MRMRNATCLALTLLVAAGLGVCAASAQAQGASQKKSARSKPANSSHRSKSSKKSSRRERGPKAPTPDRISEIHEALATDGSFSRKTNGQWDASAMERTRKFPAAQRMHPTATLVA